MSITANEARYLMSSRNFENPITDIDDKIKNAAKNNHGSVKITNINHHHNIDLDSVGMPVVDRGLGKDLKEFYESRGFYFKPSYCSIVITWDF